MIAAALGTSSAASIITAAASASSGMGRRIARARRTRASAIASRAASMYTEPSTTNLSAIVLPAQWTVLRGRRRVECRGRARDHSLLGDVRGDELGGGHVEGPVLDLDARRSEPAAANDGHLVAVAPLDRDPRAVRAVRVEGGQRRRDVERQPVMVREDGERVRADLVRDVAV